MQQYETEKVRVEQEEKRKTLGMETKEHQQRSQYQDQLARKRYDDQQMQQVKGKLGAALVVQCVQVCGYVEFM